ncbi:hypothetical protein [Oxobacter pfennigii]|uniref:hypothetical protein n=1 Tax=Oxobacter pfennigii TaxID=36849 RepID=UPI001364E181|nr:hypothetical protein [Oxobacter pfennigii]
MNLHDKVHDIMVKNEAGGRMIVNSVNENNWHIDFTYSPLFEMLCSLHVLVKLSII